MVFLEPERWLAVQPGMMRRMFNIAAGGSLLLCVGLTVLWGRSPRHIDGLIYADPSVGGKWSHCLHTRQDVDGVQSPEDDLRRRGFAAGAARFARGEGMWFGGGAIYFACTNGGPAKKGQVWRYTPSIYEGTHRAAETPGRLELFIEPNDGTIVENADNLTVAPWGDLVLAEDGVGDPAAEKQFLVGVTPRGRLYPLARNAQDSSELAGVCFSPDGATLFVNLFSPGATLAITGPWRSRDPQP